MLTSSCGNCGGAKTPAEYALADCKSCADVRKAGEEAFAKENPDAAYSDVLYAGRRALASRAHHANRNFTDPRGFNANRMIPIPPQNAQRVSPL